MTGGAFGHEADFGATVRVGAPRRDGRYPVTIAFRSSGRRVGRILTRSDLDALIRQTVSRGGDIVWHDEHGVVAASGTSSRGCPTGGDG